MPLVVGRHSLEMGAHRRDIDYRVWLIFSVFFQFDRAQFLLDNVCVDVGYPAAWIRVAAELVRQKTGTIAGMESGRLHPNGNEIRPRGYIPIKSTWEG